MSSLYELTGQLLALQEMMGDPDVDPQTVSDTMEAIDMEFSDKADGYAMVDRNLAASEEALKNEIERLTARKRAIENNRKHLKESLENAMRAVGKTKFKTDLFSFGIQKNPASVNIIDETKVPDEYLIKQEPKIDKKAIIAFVKEHGNTEYAELTQSESLRIR
ncbi:MAG: siphovirus Gp157 family protein [Oscillospiraceae bacterium]|nr:siphovirus Gp157 family protein [Oscillospiraceae bacterium]MBQ6578981.1 siphovirus Gp157 family protein [Bacteroidales bacterium]